MFDIPRLWAPMIFNAVVNYFPFPNNSLRSLFFPLFLCVKKLPILSVTEPQKCNSFIHSVYLFIKVYNEILRLFCALFGLNPCLSVSKQ